MLSLNLSLAQNTDLEEFVRLGKEFHKESPFYSLTDYSQQKMLQLFETAMISKHTQVLILLLKEENRSVGMLVGMVGSPVFSDDLIASELAWFIEPEYRGSRKALQLVYAYEEWARRMGCKNVSMSLLTTLTDASKTYERLGYTKTEISYLKAL